MGFKYRGEGRTVESVTRRSRESSGNYESYVLSDVKMFKPKEGENTVRILPPTWEDVEKWGDGWEIAVFLHYGIGQDNGAYLCLDKMKGKECPICEERSKTDDEDEKDALRASKRMLCYVIDRNDEKAGPQVWSMPMQLFREINVRSVDKKTNEIILIDHPENGYDITFVREGEGLRTRYVAVDVDRNSSTLADSEKVEDKWLDFIDKNPLPELLSYYDAAHIEKVLFGKSSRKKSEDADDEEDTGRSRSRRGGDDDSGSGRDRGGDDGGDDSSRRRSSSRRRGGDEDTEDEAPRSRRGREKEDDDEEDKGRSRSRRRGGGDDDDTADSADEGSRRGRRGGDDEKEEAEDTGRSRSRRGSDEEEDTPRRGGVERRRPSGEEDGEEEETPRGGRRGSSSSRGRNKDDDAEETGSRGRRRGGGDDDKGEDKEEPSGRAKESLGRLRNRRG